MLVPLPFSLYTTAVDKETDTPSYSQTRLDSAATVCALENWIQHR